MSEGECRPEASSTGDRRGRTATRDLAQEAAQKPAGLGRERCRSRASTSRSALRAGDFAPLRLSTPHDIRNWVDADGLDHLDLVDGAGISQNPLNSFFAWLKDRQGEAEESKKKDAIVKTLCEGNASDPRIHVVYNVPVQPYTPEGDAAEPERMNIVEVAFVSGELARRRDTRQEARQTNFTSQLESYVREGGGRTKALPIFADEIAPERDITFDNSLDPRPDEIRKAAAAGCRRTLETLYRDELRRWAGKRCPAESCCRAWLPGAPAP